MCKDVGHSRITSEPICGAQVRANYWIGSTSSSDCFEGLPSGTGHGAGTHCRGCAAGSATGASLALSRPAGGGNNCTGGAVGERRMATPVAGRRRVEGAFKSSHIKSPLARPGDSTAPCVCATRRTQSIAVRVPRNK